MQQPVVVSGCARAQAEVHKFTDIPSNLRCEYTQNFVAVVKNVFLHCADIGRTKDLNFHFVACLVNASGYICERGFQVLTLKEAYIHNFVGEYFDLA